MKKQVKKWLTLIMAFALVLGSVRYSPLTASATEVSNSEFENTVTGGDADGFDTNDDESNAATGGVHPRILIQSLGM